MAERRIQHADGSATVISDSYGFGSLTVGPLVRPEPIRDKPRRLTRERVLKKFGWSDADFDEAQRFGFPPAAHRPTLGSFALVQIWREDVLDKWAAEWREKASAILRLVR